MVGPTVRHYGSPRRVVDVLGGNDSGEGVSGVMGYGEDMSWRSGHWRRRRRTCWCQGVV